MKWLPRIMLNLSVCNQVSRVFWYWEIGGNPKYKRFGMSFRIYCNKTCHRLSFYHELTTRQEQAEIPSALLLGAIKCATENPDDLRIHRRLHFSQERWQLLLFLRFLLRFCRHPFCNPR
jgi:hypothetical protein